MGVSTPEGIIDLSDPAAITPEVLLQYNNPFGLSDKNAGPAYDKTGINVDPESFRTPLYRFESMNDSVGLQLRVLERAGPIARVDGQEFPLRNEDGSLNNDLVAQFMEAKAANKLGVEVESLPPEIGAAINEVVLGAAPATPAAAQTDLEDDAPAEPDQAVEPEVKKPEQRDDTLTVTVATEPHLSSNNDPFPVQRVFRPPADMGAINTTANLLLDGLDNFGLVGDMLKMAMGMDDEPNVYGVPANILKDLFVGAKDANGFDGRVETVKEIIAARLDGSGIIMNDAQREAFIGQLDEAIAASSEGEHNYFETDIFVEHMLGVSAHLNITFRGDDGEVYSAGGQLDDVPFVADSQDFLESADDPIEMAPEPVVPDDEFVLSPEEHDELRGTREEEHGDRQFDEIQGPEEDIFEEVDGYEVDPNTLSYRPSVLPFDQLGAGSALTVVEVGAQDIVASNSTTIGELRARMGDEIQVEELYANDNGSLYALRLSNADGLEIHIDAADTIQTFQSALEPGNRIAAATQYDEFPVESGLQDSFQIATNCAASEPQTLDQDAPAPGAAHGSPTAAA